MCLFGGGGGFRGACGHAPTPPHPTVPACGRPPFGKENKQKQKRAPIAPPPHPLPLAARSPRCVCVCGGVWLQELAAAHDKSDRLGPLARRLEETNEELRGELAAVRGRCSEAELELSKVLLPPPPFPLLPALISHSLVS